MDPQPGGRRPQARLQAVAGCLFEVALPGGAAARWEWAALDPDGAAPVTLLASSATTPPGGRAAEAGALHWFRFRAERPGRSRLRFALLTAEAGLPQELWVTVDVAPETLPAERVAPPG